MEGATDTAPWATGEAREIRWIDLRDPTPVNDDLRREVRSVLDQLYRRHLSLVEARANGFLLDAGKFYDAEDYHQEYFVRNPAQPYCAYLINPKVAKFRQQFSQKLKG